MLPFKLVSADSHVLEPPDMWLKRIDRRFLDRAPRITHEADADYFVCEASQMPKVGIGTSSSAEKQPEDIQMAERWENVLAGGYDPFARIRDMERDGIEAEILYCTFGLFLFAIDDPDLQFACFQAFNDWLANFCASFPKRLFGVAMIPTEPVERAAAEMERCARAGLRAAMISVSQDPESGYTLPLYDPLWSASEDLRMPISLHVAASKKNFTSTNNMLADFSLAYTLTMYTIAAMIFSGVFDRHPKLRV